MIQLIWSDDNDGYSDDWIAKIASDVKIAKMVKIGQILKISSIRIVGFYHRYRRLLRYWNLIETDQFWCQSDLKIDQSDLQVDWIRSLIRWSQMIKKLKFWSSKIDQNLIFRWSKIDGKNDLKMMIIKSPNWSQFYQFELDSFRSD